MEGSSGGSRHPARPVAEVLAKRTWRPRASCSTAGRGPDGRGQVRQVAGPSCRGRLRRAFQVGKSSLINARSPVTAWPAPPTPGRTREVNFRLDGVCGWSTMTGYGFAKASKTRQRSPEHRPLYLRDGPNERVSADRRPEGLKPPDESHGRARHAAGSYQWSAKATGAAGGPGRHVEAGREGLAKRRAASPGGADMPKRGRRPSFGPKIAAQRGRNRRTSRPFPRTRGAASIVGGSPANTVECRLVSVRRFACISPNDFFQRATKKPTAEHRGGVRGGVLMRPLRGLLLGTMPTGGAQGGVTLSVAVDVRGPLVIALCPGTPDWRRSPVVLVMARPVPGSARRRVRARDTIWDADGSGAGVGPRPVRHNDTRGQMFALSC